MSIAIGQRGFHHVAVIVNDLPAAVAAVEKVGYPVVARFRPQAGYDVVFADAARSRCAP
jgi:hypothetical protein